LLSVIIELLAAYREFLVTVPVYVQLASILRQQIESATLQSDRPIPSESTLRQEYGVARGAARKAVELLRDHGLVVTVRGRGTSEPSLTFTGSELAIGQPCPLRRWTRPRKLQHVFSTDGRKGPLSAGASRT
jgi:GntR family transcriptional regulator